MLIKKISINFIIFIFLFIIFDLIFSNFIHKETFKYACYKYEIDFYSLKPNCVAIEKHEPSGINFKVYTDENGYRYLGKKNKNQLNKSIIFLGDSHTYGIGLDYKNSFAGKIEKNFKNYKVLNLGLPSYSPTIYNYQLKSLIKKKIKPNKIFLILDVGDLSQESFRWKHNKENERPILISEMPRKKEKEVSGWQQFRRENFKGYRMISYHLREFSRTIKKNLKKKNNIQNEVKKTHWGEFTYTNKNNLQIKYWKNLSFDATLKKMTKNLQEISSLSRSINSEFYIVIFPWVETLEYGQNSFDYEKYAIKMCKDIECTDLINLFPHFRKLKKNSANWRKEFYLIDDIHLNKKGQDILYQEIKKKFL